MIPPLKRLPVQGSHCGHKSPCNLWFCGQKGLHEDYGTVPWETGLVALAGWRKRYGSSDFEYDFQCIFIRGGFSHYEMSIYTGGTDWLYGFIAS